MAHLRWHTSELTFYIHFFFQIIVSFMTYVITRKATNNKKIWRMRLIYRINKPTATHTHTNNMHYWYFFLCRCGPTQAMATSFMRSHTTTHHSRYDYPGRVISPSQRPLPDNTQHSQQTDIHRTPLDEWSARRRDLYLTTHDTHNRQISIGLLWTSDQPVAETSTWQHTTLTTDRHP